MRKLLLTLTPLLLAACTGGVQPINPDEIFSKLDGPKVPTIKDTLTESASNAEKQGDFKQAAMIYQQVLEKHPDNKEIAISMANAYRRAGDTDRAIAIFNQLLAKDPDNIDAKEGKGLALMAKGDFETPGPLFEDVMKTDKTRWKTLNALGILFTTRNMQREAQMYFEEALKQSPGNVSIINNRGLSQALNRDYPAALATLTQAQNLAQTGTPARKRVDLNMALVYASAGKLDEARAIAEQYYSGPTLANNLGLYAHLAKDDDLAKSYLNMALTDSKVFYEKAWNNLQSLETTTGSLNSKPKPDSGNNVLTPPAATDKSPVTATDKALKSDSKGKQKSKK